MADKRGTIGGTGTADVASRIEGALHHALSRPDARLAARGFQTPPKLIQAMQYAVFPGGARVRPRLVTAVAHACGEDRPALTDAAAAALEFLHCASLVHDDLPCFDDADMRRGRPSVHAAFGEAIAVLAGDGLIVLAFQTLADAGRTAPERLGPLLLTISDAVGVPGGIVAGQAWESEHKVDLSAYQRAKTGALFVAAAVAGAEAAGADPTPWRRFGDLLGEAYQVADDIHDQVASRPDLGKPVGRDAELGRPNAVGTLGLDGAVRRLQGLVSDCKDSIPRCRGEDALRALIDAQAKRFLPKSLLAQLA
jgi:geranylgeranyl diphosphate synthase type II